MSRPTTPKYNTFPHTNFLLARKADDLREDEIRAYFVEPFGLLQSTLLLRQHFFIVGGRGTGKTITLRKLGHSVSAPAPDFPYLGVYVCVDVSECAPFGAEKIGPNNGSVFESFLAGILVEQLVRACDAHAEAIGLDRQRFAEILKSNCVGRLHAGNLAELADEISSINQQLRAQADAKLAAVRTSDVPLTLTYRLLNQICGSLRSHTNLQGQQVSIIFLLDRYGDLGPFLQSVGNGLFGLPAPRHFYVRASIKPYTHMTYDIYGAGRINEPQDFRTVNLERFLDPTKYQDLLRSIVEKQLALEKKRQRDSKLRTDVLDFLQPNKGSGYGGFENLAALSDGIIFNFLYLLEKCVELTPNIEALHRGEQITTEVQHAACKQAADILFNGISATVEGDHGAVKYLTNHLLKQMAIKKVGPEVFFESAHQSGSQEILRKAVTESIFKEMDSDSEFTPDDWHLQINRIFAPRHNSPLNSTEFLRVSNVELAKIIKDAESLPMKRATPTTKQQPLWPGTMMLDDPGLVRPSVSHVGGHLPMVKFMREAHRTVDLLAKTLEYSQRIVADAKRELELKVFEQFGSNKTLGNITVGLAGSFARGEAVAASSDADLFVAGNIAEKDVPFAMDMLTFFSGWFSDRGIKAPRPQKDTTLEAERMRPFPCIIDTDQIVEVTTKPNDMEEDRTRRMCLVTESVCLFNQNLFDKLRTTVLTKLEAFEYADVNTPPEALMHEFVYWCKSFLQRIEVENKHGLKYDKRKLQRNFMRRSTLLGCIAHVSQGTGECYKSIVDIFQLPPVLRLYHAVDNSPELIRGDVKKHVADAISNYNDALTALVTLDSSALKASQSNVERECEKSMAERFENLTELLMPCLEARTRQSFEKVIG